MAYVPVCLFAQAPRPLIFDQPMPFVITPDSKIWLEGKANVVNFTCKATEIETTGRLAGLDTTSTVPSPHGDVNLQVKIPVHKLNCGRQGINRDMKQTLNANEHPYITYKLDRNQLNSAQFKDGLMQFDIQTWGGLHISGTDKTEEIQVNGQFLGPWQFRITGSHQVSMSEYGLTPPSPMMGLIRVEDKLEVHFDVTFCLRSCDSVVQLN